VIWIVSAALSTVVVTAIVEHLRDKRVCPACGSHRVARTNWARWSGGMPDGARTGGTWTEFRCNGCQARLYRANQGRIVTEDVWRAGGGREEIPTATARPRSSPLR
jgi:hypothetical protein